MSAIATAIVGSAVIGGVMGDKAAKKQANASRYATDVATGEQARQFDLQREDTAPYREAGTNALARLEEGIDQSGQPLPGFQYSGQQPEFEGGNRFEFNLEADPGYQFARDEGIRATNREMAAGGKYGSGNRLAAIADRVTGVASQFANDAYNRQMGESQTNYGRDVGEYDINRSRESEQYGRGMGEFGIDYSRNQDTYGREQDRLNRLASLSGVGQSAVAQSAQAGSNMASNIGNIQMANASRQGAAAQNKYGAYNNAVQGGISNYLTYQGTKQPTYTGGGGGKGLAYNQNALFANPDLGVRK